MPCHADDLKLLTLDLISPARRVEQSQLDALTPADWAEILRMARQHRIGPMMRWQLQHAHAHLRVPPTVSQTLDRMHRRSTTRTMDFQRALQRVHDILQAAGITFVALKGVHLAYGVYPHPALRPLRDLDILVRPEQALDAQAALIAGGLSTIERFEKMPQSRKDNAQHLPQLMAGKVMVEVHRRALQLDHDHRPGQDITDDPEFWHRCVSATVAGITFKAPSVEDQFLHLVVHGTYHHMLSNGPLLLSDLGFLVQSSAPDWAALREAADRRGFGRGLDLADALLRRYWGVAGARGHAGAVAAEHAGEAGHAGEAAAACTGAVPDSVLDTAALLMLRGESASKDATIRQSLAAAPTLTAKCGVLLRAACPPRETISYACAVDEHSPWLWLYYPLWWWRHASRRLKPLLRGKRPYLLAGSSDQVATVRQWLRPQEPAAR
jgi:hypothetical protein